MIWTFSLEVFYFYLKKNNWSQIFLLNAKIFQKTKPFRVQISLGTKQATEHIFHWNFLLPAETRDKLGLK